VKGAVTTLELTRAERSAARRSAETRAIVPSVELITEVELDMGEAPGAGGTAQVSRADILVAVGRALREFPRVNGGYRDGRYELYSRVNVAINLPAGDGNALVTLFDADQKDAAVIAAELSDLSQRAHEGTLSAGELSGATFTVFPPEPREATLLTPLIQPPQAAALAVSSTRQAPVVRAGALTVGRKLWLTLACDHRIVQTELGSKFLEEVKAALEDVSA
jgi:pyruvate dehydrogenase E2 component (dihydrolipoamide acetyltransferase)